MKGVKKMENQEMENQDQETGDQAQAVENQDQWCFAWIPGEQGVEGANRAGLLKNAKWAPNSDISVSFLDGDESVKQRVRKVAQRWTAPGMANLRFTFQDNNDSMIRISFKYPGSWSVLGNQCLSITDLTRPTMNYGWLKPESTDDELRRVVLHEFGHALGLIHEHQSPAGGIPWNRDAVIRDLSGPPNNWDLEKIEHNMFRPIDKKESNFSSLDPKSIMMYPLPAKWTTNGFSVGLNSDLSEMDKAFIREQYSALV
jgi:serralysin